MKKFRPDYCCLGLEAGEEEEDQPEVVVRQEDREQVLSCPAGGLQVVILDAKEVVTAFLSVP